MTALAAARSGRLFCLLLCAALAGAACSRDTGAERPVNRTLSVGAGPRINIYDDRPTPVVLRLYQLSGRSAFDGADFWALFDTDAEALAGEVVDRRSLSPLYPGEQRLVDIDLSPDTRYLGVFGEFADMDTQTTKAVAAVDDASIAGLRIAVDAGGVTIHGGAEAAAAKTTPGLLGRLLGRGE